MSDAVAEQSAPVEPTAPTPTLPELLRSTLEGAAAPLTLKELAKALPRPKKVKADEFEASLPGYLAEDLQAGRVFKFASGKAGAERYWNRDEKNAIQEAVRTAAAEPKKLAELKKLAVGHTKADKPFAESIVDELVAEKQLHEHPGKGPLFGRNEPISPNDRDKVSADLLARAATPDKLANLIKATQKETKADKEFVTAVANELVEAKRLHAHGKLHGRDEPISPNDKVKVSAALLEKAATPAKLAELVKQVQKETKADKPFVEEVANELVATEKIFKQEPAKAGLFGLVKPKPPHPLETPTGKKEFDKLVAAAKKLLASAAGLQVPDLLSRLKLGLEAPVPEVTEEIRLTETAVQVVGGHTAAPTAATGSGVGDLGDLIMSALGDAAVVSVADLRMKMKPEHQGDIFNETVLKLTDEQRVIVHQDADPSQYSDGDHAKFIRDGDRLYTAISKGN